ncbi:MAG: GNAT family N-acetyltransferase [Defluviitaleaceae bacterium]|nr:GNAT family N-acetyltransferase [Defluviitaleaceae bacterium]
MESFERLNQTNLHEIKKLMENDGMPFDIDALQEFAQTSGAYGFVYHAESKPIGFAYGCRLSKPDGKKEMYLHSIDILPEYQDKGHGSKFFKSILDFSKENGFCGMFLSSSQSLQNARHIYEKFGGIRECEDEIIFSYNFED